MEHFGPSPLIGPILAQNPAIYAIYYGFPMVIMVISRSPCQPRILQFMPFIMRISMRILHFLPSGQGFGSGTCNSCHLLWDPAGHHGFPSAHGGPEPCNSCHLLWSLSGHCPHFGPALAQNPAIYAIYYGILIAILAIPGSACRPRILQFMPFIMELSEPLPSIWTKIRPRTLQFMPFIMAS